MWEPRRLTTPRAFTAYYRASFTLLLLQIAIYAKANLISVSLPRTDVTKYYIYVLHHFSQFLHHYGSEFADTILARLKCGILNDLHAGDVITASSHHLGTLGTSP
jgi:hypothetical protein